MAINSNDTAEDPRGSSGAGWREYPGWHVVGVAALFHGLMGGIGHIGLSVYFLPLTREFGVSRAMMSVAFALRTLEGGLEGPIIGYLVDRLGGRMMVIIGVLLGGVGYLLMATTNSYELFLVVFLGLVSLGVSVPHHGLFATINQWFRRRLGLAMSLAISGSAIGGFIITPMVAWIVLNESWRLASVFSGILLLCLGLPLVLMVRSPKPGETEPEDSIPAPARATGAQSRGPEARQQMANVDFSIGEALRTSTYWLLAVSIGLRLTGQQVLIVHIVPILVSRGVSEGVAAGLVALMSLLRLPSVIGFGLVSDMWSRQRVASLAMFSGTLAAAVAILGPDGLATGALFVLFFALAQGSNAITWALVGQYFGRAKFASLRGGMSLIQSVMSFGAPIAAGWVFDTTGSYNYALVGVGLAYFMSAAIFWVLKTPTRRTAAEKMTPSIGD